MQVRPGVWRCMESESVGDAGEVTGVQGLGDREESGPYSSFHRATAPMLPHSWSGSRLLSPLQPLPCEELSEPRPCPWGSLCLTVTSRGGLQCAPQATGGCAGHRWLDKCPWIAGGLHKEQEGKPRGVSSTGTAPTGGAGTQPWSDRGQCVSNLRLPSGPPWWGRRMGQVPPCAPWTGSVLAQPHGRT